MLLRVDDVGKVVSDMTRRIEADAGAITAMVSSGNQFEQWWRGAIFLEFTRAPWCRRPGWRASRGGHADVSMETTWTVADQRRSCSREKRETGGRPQHNRVDLEVRAAPTGVQFHVIEFKLFDRKKDGWPVADQVRGIRKDILGLQNLPESALASAWSIVLGFRFGDPEEFRRALADAVEDTPKPVYRLAIDDIADGVWLAARRVC